MPIDNPPVIYSSAYIVQGDQWSIKQIQPKYFVLTGGGAKELVKISMEDGSITFGPDYKPDEAAQIFWSAISSEYREFLAWKKSK